MADYDMSMITGVYLAGAWHNVDPGSLSVDVSAVFQDVQGGTAAPGGTWFAFTETIADATAGTQVTTRYTGMLADLGGGRTVFPPQPIPVPGP